ncbi:MAG TPA: hypothetical protein VIS09_04705 [Streptomyces sp.]
MPVYSPLTHALAAALADVLRFIEGSEDEQMDPDDAVKVLEGVAHLVVELSSAHRSELIGLLGTMAIAESDPARRAFLEGFRKALGALMMRSDLCCASGAGRACGGDVALFTSSGFWHRSWGVVAQRYLAVRL